MQNLIENLRYKFMQNSKLKYYVIIGVVIFILIIAIVLYMCLSKVDKTEPEIEDIPIDDFIEEEVVVEEKEVKQEETVNLLKAFITDKRNLSYKYIYEILIGSGESQSKSLVTADKNTVFLDLNTKTTINPSNIGIGETIILYATGKYTASNLMASVICKGSDTSYRYAIIDKWNGESLKDCEFILTNSKDKLIVNSDTNIINGLSGGSVVGLAEISYNTKILYKYNPNFEITNEGNIYTCSEIILLGGVG